MCDSSGWDELLVQVDVGNLLRFKAYVLYTEVQNVDRPLIHIEVVANVTQPEKRSSEVRLTIEFSRLCTQFILLSSVLTSGLVLCYARFLSVACLKMLFKRECLLR
jgi:hypothetical protein